MRVLQTIVDPLQDSLCVFQHVVVPEANDAIAALLQCRGPSTVSVYSLLMTPAVELDNEMTLQTTEVSDEGSYWKLAAKLRPGQLSSAKSHPQPSLGGGLSPA